MEDNIKIVLKEIGWADMSCIHLAEDWDKQRAVVNTVNSI